MHSLGSFVSRCKFMAFGVAGAATLMLPITAGAQVYRSDLLLPRTVILAEGAVSNPETVRLLAGLASIERDMMLGMLFLQDGLTSTIGSHFTHPRVETWPGLKDGLVAAGVADFENLLIAVEQATDKDAVTKAYTEANTAVLLAQAALHGSEKDQVLAMVEGVRNALARFNAAGPTEVVNYQDGWAGLMIERGKVDLLMQSADPAVAKSATDMAMALDNVILSMPDPAVTEPVTFDPAPVADLLAQMESMAGSL